MILVSIYLQWSIHGYKERKKKKKRGKEGKRGHNNEETKVYILVGFFK